MNTTCFLAVLLTLSLSCQTKPKQETDSKTAFVEEDSAALLAKRRGPDAPRTVPDRLVRALYFEHDKTENPFRETKNRALIDEFFANVRRVVFFDFFTNKFGTGVTGCNYQAVFKCYFFAKSIG